MDYKKLLQCSPYSSYIEQRLNIKYIEYCGSDVGSGQLEVSWTRLQTYQTEEEALTAHNHNLVLPASGV